ncbi:MAG TPA: hypothetical protein VFU98_12500 [Microlunatus sp.]|nr:hypothetical protein [Microlunatus sp.]
MGADAVLVGEIAHIEGALPDSARFNSMMSNEQRRSYDNLLLLCATHHTVIDRDAKQWTVARLKDLKHKHEAIYTAAVDQLRRQVGDITEGVIYTPASNGRVLLDQHGLDDHERADSCIDINRFAERLSKIPADARSLLSLIVIRGDKVPAHVAMGNWPGEFQILKRVLKSIADCTDAHLRRHVEVLEHFDLLRCDDEPFDGPPLYIVGNSTQGLGWALLQDIRDLAGTDRETIRRVLCDLDFSALDRE